MVDFSQLLKKPAGQAPKPAALPPETYNGVIKSFEVGDQNKNKTPYVRTHLGLTGWPDSIAPEDRVTKSPDGATVLPIDLAKRPLRRDFFLTDDALFRLDELLRSCGIEPNGRPYEECLPELVGKPVLVEVQQTMIQQGDRMGETINQVGKVVGTGS